MRFLTIRRIKAAIAEIKGKIRSLGFHYSLENIKNTPLEKLPLPVKWERVAGDRKVWVEIGSGHGEMLYENRHGPRLIIGFEVKSRYSRLIRSKLRKREYSLIYKGDGYKEIGRLFGRESMDRIIILFPDPWHKDKHKKRRPITAEFFRKSVDLLKPGGEIIIATDWADYAEFIATQVNSVTDMYNVSTGPYIPADHELPETHYYRKWQRIGREFTYFSLVKKGVS